MDFLYRLLLDNASKQQLLIGRFCYFWGDLSNSPKKLFVTLLYQSLVKASLGN